MKASADEAWCTWCEKWEMTLGCCYCEAEFPADYARAHILYACPTHPQAITP